MAMMIQEETTKPHEGTVEAHESMNVEKSAPLAAVEESPIQDVVKSAVLATMEDSPIQDISVEEFAPLPAMDDSQSCPSRKPQTQSLRKNRTCTQMSAWKKVQHVTWNCG
ncbi:hypothetical protein ACP4OV_030190 [Aristida adscensionis]